MGRMGSRRTKPNQEKGGRQEIKGRRKKDVLTYVITITMNAGYNVGYTKVMSVYRGMGEKPCLERCGKVV